MNNNIYSPVPTESLKINTVLNFNIFIQKKGRFVLFRKKNHPFSEETLHKLIENKIYTIHITKEDWIEYEKYQSSIRDNSSIDLTEEGFTPPFFDKPENVEKYLKSYLNYFPIEKETLIPGSKVNFNVYEKKHIDVEFYFGPESKRGSTATIPKDVLGSQFPMVIQKDDIPLYKEYLQGLTSEHLKDSTVLKEIQCSLLRENSKLTVKEILENPTNVENIQKSSKVVETIINGILDVENQFYNLLRITSDDFYAYTHALNVCTLCIGLGLAINLKRETDIKELGLGALLHDIGKNMIAPYIINKPGRLTKEEFKTVQSHVVEGKDLLMRSNKKTPENVFIPILQHHEKLSGSGYPYGLKGPQIHPFGRITAIVNFYDTLITERPFKDAYKPFEALQLISENHEDYDQELLKEFIAMLGQQKVAV